MYSVVTVVQQRLLIDRNSKKSGLTEVPLLGGRTLNHWVDSRLYQTLLSIFEGGGVFRSGLNVVRKTDRRPPLQTPHPLPIPISHTLIWSRFPPPHWSSFTPPLKHKRSALAAFA
jgi:hypothetical protein